MKDNNVIKVQFGDSRSDCDVILDNAKGIYDTIVVAGYDKDDMLVVFGSGEDGASVNYLLDQVKRNLLSGLYYEDEGH